MPSLLVLEGLLVGDCGWSPVKYQSALAKTVWKGSALSSLLTETF